jgi:hypothetical protein
MSRLLDFVVLEWRTFSVLLCLLIVFVKLGIVGRRVRRTLDNRSAWQRKKDLFRRLFGG